MGLLLDNRLSKDLSLSWPLKLTYTGPVISKHFTEYFGVKSILF